MRALSPVALIALLGCTRSSSSPSGWRSASEPVALCVLETGRGWQPREPERVHDLFLPGTTHTFARLTGGAARARFWFSEGPRAEWQPVELEDEGIVVRGMIASDATSLAATGVVTMDGHVSSTALTPFQWQGATPQGLQLSYGPPRDFTPVTPTRVTRACTDMSLDAVILPPSGTLRTAGAPGARLMTLVADRPVTLHAAAEGPVVGTFASDHPRPVSAVARAVGWLRIIAIDDPRFEVDGWVHDADVRTIEGSAPSNTPAAPTPTPAPSASPPLADHPIRCTTEIRFAATEPKTLPQWSGSIRAGTWFARLGDSGDDAVYVGAIHGRLQAATATSWIARRSDLASCEQADAGAPRAP